MSYIYTERLFSFPTLEFRLQITPLLEHFRTLHQISYSCKVRLINYLILEFLFHITVIPEQIRILLRMSYTNTERLVSCPILKFLFQVKNIAKIICCLQKLTFPVCISKRNSQYLMSPGSHRTQVMIVNTALFQKDTIANLEAMKTTSQLRRTFMLHRCSLVFRRRWIMRRAKTLRTLYYSKFWRSNNSCTMKRCRNFSKAREN